MNLTDIPVAESVYLTPGTAIRSPEGIFMHPLDRIAIQHPEYDDRMTVAMGWILDQANRKFVRLEQNLDAAREVRA